MKRLCNVLFIDATATEAYTGESFVVFLHALTSNRVLFEPINYNLAIVRHDKLNRKRRGDS